MQSDHDKLAEKIRTEAREQLIEQYILEAAQASDAYGFLNAAGHEVPDPTVVEPPLGYIQQPDLMTLMRQMITRQISDIADANEFETFEEADDFDVDDDVDYSSPYELYFDPAPGTPKGPPEDLTRRDPNAPPPPPVEGEILPPEPPPAPEAPKEKKEAK